MLVINCGDTSSHNSIPAPLKRAQLFNSLDGSFQNEMTKDIKLELNKEWVLPRELFLWWTFDMLHISPQTESGSLSRSRGNHLWKMNKLEATWHHTSCLEVLCHRSQQNSGGKLELEQVKKHGWEILLADVFSAQDPPAGFAFEAADVPLTPQS